MSNSLEKANCWGTDDEKLLLKAALLSGESAINAWKTWRQLKGADFDNINYVSYTLLPLVSRNLSSIVENDELLDRCKSIYRRTWVFNQLLWRKISPVLRQFQHASIDKIVLLKGMAMITHFYKDFGVRVLGDIDVLIPKHQVKKAIDILFDTGWTTHIPRFEPEMLTWHAANFKLDPNTNLDLHWSLLFESIIHIDQQILHDAQPIQLDHILLYIPNATDLLIQTCVHGVKHSPVPLLRWICDAMTILNHSRNQIDWQRLITIAKQAHFCTSLKAAFIYLNAEFSANIPKHIINQLNEYQPSRLERWENWGKRHDYFIIKSWTRFCMQNGYTSWWQQIVHTPSYMQNAARLSSKWQIPFYACFWITKRFYRLIKHVN